MIPIDISPEKFLKKFKLLKIDKNFLGGAVTTPLQGKNI